MAEEKGARDKLTQQWTQFSSSDRVASSRAGSRLGEMPSYVELQTCLEIARETKSLPELKSFIKKKRLFQVAAKGGAALGEYHHRP